MEIEYPLFESPDTDYGYWLFYLLILLNWTQYGDVVVSDHPVFSNNKWAKCFVFGPSDVYLLWIL